MKSLDRHSEFVHIKGERNVIADAQSQLDADFSTKPTNESMANVFLTTKEIKETDFPLSPILIAKYQGLDKTLRHKCISKTNDNFSTTKLESVEIITYQGKKRKRELIIGFHRAVAGRPLLCTASRRYTARTYYVVYYII